MTKKNSIQLPIAMRKVIRRREERETMRNSKQYARYRNS